MCPLWLLGGIFFKVFISLQVRFLLLSYFFLSSLPPFFSFLFSPFFPSLPQPSPPSFSLSHPRFSLSTCNSLLSALFLKVTLNRLLALLCSQGQLWGDRLCYFLGESTSQRGWLVSLWPAQFLGGPSASYLGIGVLFGLSADPNLTM